MVSLGTGKPAALRHPPLIRRLRQSGCDKTLSACCTASGMGSTASPSFRHEVAQAQEALRAATDEADALMHSGGAARMRLDEAGSRLASLRSLMAQLQADAGL